MSKNSVKIIKLIITFKNNVAKFKYYSFRDDQFIKNCKFPASKLLTNYNSETPNKQKLSSLMGSIYIPNDTCTN